MYHCVALIKTTDNNEVWVWGQNIQNSIGNKNVGSYVLTPIKLTVFSNYNIIDISVGTAHNFALTGDGIVFGWGWNAYGQVGEYKCEVPVQLSSFLTIKIRKIHTAGIISFFITDEGAVYSCGSHSYGALGYSGTSDQFVPKLIENLAGKNVTFITGRDYSFIAKTKNGEFYCWGKNSINELSLTNTSVVELPILHPYLNQNKEICTVIGGYSQAFYYITNSGSVYFSGYDPSEQNANISADNPSSKHTLLSNYRVENLYINTDYIFAYVRV